jgi:hypothetical protein
MLREETFKQKMAAKEEMFKQKMAATEEIRALCPNEGACAELHQSMFAFDLWPLLGGIRRLGSGRGGRGGRGAARAGV